MKTKILIAILLSSFVIRHSSFAQGALTPPGAPAPTMITLSQIEPRTPIAAAPFIITNSGAYYLATNLTVSGGNAVTINASGVTLDLNGFTISSTAPSANGYAVLLTNIITDIAILNGHIVSHVTNNGGVYGGGGFGFGIALNNSSPVNVRVSGVSVSGCLYSGIYLGNLSSLVDSCTVQTVGGYGIAASIISRSVAYQCGGYAIYAYETASDCYGYSMLSDAVTATSANNCYGYASTGYGINATVANNCYGQSGSGRGVTANAANNCYGYSNSSYGIYVYGTAIGCYGVTSTGTGLGGYLANACYSSTGDGGISYHYNMP